MKTINKLKISQLVNKKTSNTVAQKLISDIVSIVANYIIDEIGQDRPVSIDNFGTFSIRSVDGIVVRGTKKVLTFKLHTNFSKLWHIKRNRFRKSKKFNKNLGMKTFKKKTS